MATKSKYLIIGFGEFGAAAANHLQNTKSAGELELTILDMHSEQAASLDLYKIVREDYANLHRMKHAIYVHQQWKSNPMFQPYYHSTGRVVVYHPPSISVLNQIDKNRSSLGLPPRKRLTMQSIASCPVSGLSPRERKAMEFISGIMENTNDQENLTFVYNEDDGVVQWDRCMSEMRKSCKKRGANVRKAEVQGLVIGGDWVEAIQLKDGEEIKTDDTNIILAAGSWIMQLLARSNITLPLPARAPVATGVFAFHLRLSDAQREKFLDIPPLSVYGIDMPPADGGEYLPPIMHNGIVKVGWTLPFRNMCNHPSVSYPEDVSTSYLACKALHQVRKWVESYLPELKGAEIIAIRSPWDGVTRTQTPLITRHPEVGNLIIAGGGSYNHAKDAPTIGRTIVQVTEGVTETDYGWDPPIYENPGNQPHLLTDNDFMELEREAAMDSAVVKIHSEMQSKPCYI